MSDPVPAVLESDAIGEIAAIFADIRAVYRVGAVNLIWRHLATIPGALPWAWRMVRPVYVDDTIARVAEAFKADMVSPVLPSVPPEVFAAIGLSYHDLSEIRNVLSAYDRTNSMALIALTALTGWDDPVSQTPHAISLPQAPPAHRALPLPALTPVDAMPPHLAALVERLNRFGTSQERPILASMYRHLSHWPAYLGIAWTALAPTATNGSLDAAIDATSRRARMHAMSIKMMGGPPPIDSRDQILAAIQPFRTEVLVKMVVICGMLLRMTPEQDA